MIKLMICFGIGLAGHQASPLFDSLEKRLNGRGGAWPRIGRYAFGGILIQLSTRVMLRGVNFSRNSEQNGDLVHHAMSSALIGLGAGVATGYVLDMANK